MTLFSMDIAREPYMSMVQIFTYCSVLPLLHGFGQPSPASQFSGVGSFPPEQISDFQPSSSASFFIYP